MNPNWLQNPWTNKQNQADIRRYSSQFSHLVHFTELGNDVKQSLISLVLIKLNSKWDNEVKGGKNMAFDFRRGLGVRAQLL